MSSNALPLQLALVLSVLGAPAVAQTTWHASISSGGALGNGHSEWPAISADGRFVVFSSQATNLDPGDSDPVHDAYLHDLQTSVTELVCVNSNWEHAAGYSLASSVSADGRYVSFHSNAGNLTPADTDSDFDIFVRDRLNSTTTPASVSTAGLLGNGDSEVSVLSPDGRYVAFRSFASNLVPADTNGEWDVFVHDLQTGATERVNLGPGGAEAHGDSYVTSLSFDGRYVLFSSLASDLVPGDTNNERDIFVHDRQAGVTTRVSVSSAGVPSNGDSHAGFCSADGRFVTFVSVADNLVPGDTNGISDVFVHELASGVTTRVSVSSGGAEADRYCISGGISADGRFVSIWTESTTFVPADPSFFDVFLHDRWNGETTRVGLAFDGSPPSGDCFGAALSADGRHVAFHSDASNLVPGNPGGLYHVYARDRGPASAFTPLCPGDSACPCGNAGAPGHGCENSSGSGGALLVASGDASLSADSVQLSSTGELASVLSVALQGDALIAPILFGDGLRCAGGNLKRLYIGNASGGAFTVPQGGNPSVSVRSAALGDPIPLGASRVYQVYYRDPTLGFCPAPPGNAFNVTNVIAIAWGS